MVCLGTLGCIEIKNLVAQIASCNLKRRLFVLVVLDDLKGLAAFPSV